MSTRILPWLYLGNATDAVLIDDNRTKDKNWQIINVLEPELIFPEDKVDELIIPILYKIGGKHHLDWNKVFQVGDLINKIHIENPKDKLLCHCGAGQERSPLVIAYYLVRYENMKVDEAYDFIKQRRPEIFRCDKDYKW